MHEYAFLWFVYNQISNNAVIVIASARSSIHTHGREIHHTPLKCTTHRIEISKSA